MFDWIMGGTEPVGLTAGIAAIPAIPFLLYSALGTAAWTIALAYTGKLPGSQYDLVEKYLAPVAWIVLGGQVALCILRVARYRRGGSASHR